MVRINVPHTRNYHSIHMGGIINIKSHQLFGNFNILNISLPRYVGTRRSGILHKMLQN